jgi:hypothetical protein
MEDERKFLHDISSPLAVAIFVLEVALEDVKPDAILDKDSFESLQKAFGALEKLKKMIEDRRNSVKSQQAA